MGPADMVNGECGATDRPEIRWSYRTILETGSDELKEILEIITGGYRPGIAKEEKHEDQ